MSFAVIYGNLVPTLKKDIHKSKFGVVIKISSE